MTDIACLSNLKNNDENQDITRKIKRMKLNNSSSAFAQNQANYQLPCFNLKEDCNLQNLFPYIKEDTIQDTVRKSLNTSDAVNKLHQMNTESFLMNKNFSSLHKSNKKRRFCNLESYQNSGYHQPCIEEEAKMPESRSKILMNDTQLDDFINREAEEIIKRFRESKSIDEARSFLTEKLVKFSNQTLCSNEINIQLNNLIEDNNKLKKAILLLDKKWEQNKIVNKEIDSLRQEYESLKRVHSNQIQNNNLLEYILKQNEN